MSDRLSRLAPLTGILFAALAVAGVVTSSGETPNANASVAKVISFYTAHRSSIETSSILFAIAFLIVVFFAGSLRSYLRTTAAAEGAAALVVAGSVLMAAGAILGSAMEYGLAHNLTHLNTGAIQAVNVINNEIFLPILAGGCVFGIASGVAILRGAALPRWLGWAAIAIGIAVLVPPISQFVLLVFALWTIVVSILIYMRSAPAGAASAATHGLTPSESAI